MLIPGAVGGRAEAEAGDPGAGVKAGEVEVTAGGAGVNPHPGNQGYYLILVFFSSNQLYAIFFFFTIN